MRLAISAISSTLDVDLAALCEAATPWVQALRITDQRVQAAPDARTVRYYQTIGLLDRPLRYDGRSARYGQRHLLQLIAVRALQSNGLSLAQVQALLAGATNQELQQTVASSSGDVMAETIAMSESTPGDLADEPAPAVHSTSAPAPSALVAVELAPGVVVTIDSRIHTDAAHTITVLRRALASSLADAPDASRDAASTDAPQGELS